MQPTHNNHADPNMNNTDAAGRATQHCKQVLDPEAPTNARSLMKPYYNTTMLRSENLVYRAIHIYSLKIHCKRSNHR